MVLTGGQLDVAGQILLTSGLYAIWLLATNYKGKWFSRRALSALASILFGWTIGFLIASPDILHTFNYVQTGARIAERANGAEERPPIGLAALPQLVLPRIYGSTEEGSIPAFFPKGQANLQESSVVGFVGILATLFLLPLGLSSRRRRVANVFWLFLAVFGLGWTLNLPGLVPLLRLPILNMMSHNRFVFATGFAILVMAATGLEELITEKARWRKWYWLPLGIFVAVAYWAAIRLIMPPEPIATKISAALKIGKSIDWVKTPSDLAEVKAWFAGAYGMSLLLSVLGLSAWLLLYFGRLRGRWPVFVLGALLLGELFWFGSGWSAQCDPALYFPKVPALDRTAKSGAGRVIGYGCLPARLAEIAGLRDIRGYDAVDPARLMDVLDLAREPEEHKISYARTQWFIPKVQSVPPDGIRLSPVLDMLGVRYVILRKTPPPEMAKTLIQSTDYWIPENRSALPRVFVPAHVELVADSAVRLTKMASSQFDPRKVAYVETPVALPDSCRGTAEVVNEISTRVTVSAHMETAGLLVLADLWDSGWNASVNGQPAPILRANHAIRGVVLPAGTSTIEFRYAPASWTWGLRLAGLGAALLLGWLAVVRMRREEGILSADESR